MKRISLTFIIILLLSGCSWSTKEKMDMLLERIETPDSFELLYQKEVDGGMLVIYKDNTGLRHAFYSNSKGVWNISSNSELNPSDGFAWDMTNDPDIPKATFAGIITNNQIEKVIVRQEKSEKLAEIVKTEQGRIWFTYFDQLEKGTNGHAYPLKIEALSSEGNIIWKEGVYAGEYYRGETKQK